VAKVSTPARGRAGLKVDLVTVAALVLAIPATGPTVG
jgi:hypothetical protein